MIHTHHHNQHRFVIDPTTRRVLIWLTYSQYVQLHELPDSNLPLHEWGKRGPMGLILNMGTYYPHRSNRFISYCGAHMRASFGMELYEVRGWIGESLPVALGMRDPERFPSPKWVSWSQVSWSLREEIRTVWRAPETNDGP